MISMRIFRYVTILRVKPFVSTANILGHYQEELESLLEALSFMPGFEFKNDVTYTSFLNRVRDGELKLRSQGLWNVHHPWLNIFVPRSGIIDFDRGVFRSILGHDNSTGPILIYPMNRNKYACSCMELIIYRFLTMNSMNFK